MLCHAAFLLGVLLIGRSRPSDREGTGRVKERRPGTTKKERREALLSTIGA
jgi:hypothetical protein